MLKKLFVTDTHLGLYSDSEVWLNIVYEFFKHVVDFCKDNDVKTIIHGGDFFHNRRSLNTKTQSIAHSIASYITNNSLKMKIIVGNHDCYYKNKLHPHTLELFRKYENIEIIEKPKVVDNILLLPWGSIPSGSNAEYVFGHFAINGFHMNDSYKCKDGVEKSIFKSFKKVFSGHFHTPSSKDNIVYLGAPYGQTFHDAGGTRGFYVFDEGKLKFYEYTKAPKFILLHTEDLDLSSVKGNIVRIVFDKDYGTNKNQKIVDKVLAEEPFQYSMKYSNKEENESEIEDAQMESKDELVNQFIDTQNFSTNIKISTLKSMFRKLMKEAEEI